VGGNKSASAGGGGPALCTLQTGPDAQLRYLAGGVGTPSFPGVQDATGPDDWRNNLGRYWSHDYAERVVLDPDEDHVWLITKFGSFREFTDTDSDGTYDQVSPSDEYRTLVKTASGWDLFELDGSTQKFRSDGRWSETFDRNNNRTWAEYYPGEDILWKVHFPDQVWEEFTYHENPNTSKGKIKEITKYGIDDSPKETWKYFWSVNQLTRIERPDGVALEFFYNDTRYVGYLTRLELVSNLDPGNRRVIGAWAYDDFGNVIQTWQGDTITGSSGEDQPGIDAIELHEIDFSNIDDPEPSQGFTGMVSVTGPLGDMTTYVVDRDSGSEKPRIASVSGDCPVCSAGPNTTFDYADEFGHPLRVEFTLDQKNGTKTSFTYNARGQRVTRTEADGLGPPLERTTTWEYLDPDFDLFPSAVFVDSVDGAPAERRETQDYDASGNSISQTRTGIESGGNFTDITLTPPTPEGKVALVDPPGFGTSDVTTFQYDPARGGLVSLSRTDPLVGETSFDHDPHNRRIAVTDPNGVTTETQFGSMSRVDAVIQRIGVLDVDFELGDLPQEGDLVTTFEYNEFGDLFRISQPEDNVVEYGYDEVGRLESIERKKTVATDGERVEYDLDDSGNRTYESFFPPGSAIASRITEFSYTSPCRLEKITEGFGSTQPSVTELGYDCNGNLETVWDAEHDRTSFPNGSLKYEYDELNRIKSATVAPGDVTYEAKTEFDYDHQDHLVEVEDAAGNITSFTYSDRDLLTEENSATTGNTVHQYSPHGVRTLTIDSRGNIVNFISDVLDRIETIEHFLNEAVTTDYVYDEDPSSTTRQNLVGRLVRIVRPGNSIEYDYDRFGRMTRDGPLVYGYDDNGNRDTVVYPGGLTASYSFDFATGRPESLTLSGGGLNQPVNAVQSASYLPFGPLASLALGNGLTETRIHDSRYAMDRIQLGSGTSSLLDWEYTTDDVMNVTAITDHLDSTNNRNFSYEEFSYFLTCAAGPWSQSATCGDPPAGDPLEWTYDRIGNRTTETTTEPGRRTDTYNYISNGLGNTPELSTIDLGPPLSATHTYSFSNGGHLESVDTGGNQVLLNYDDTGRLNRIDRQPAGDILEISYDGRSYLQRISIGVAAGQFTGGIEDHIFSDGFESGDFSAWSSCLGGQGCLGTSDSAVDAIYSSDGVLFQLSASGGESSLVFYFDGRPIAQLDRGPFIGKDWKYLTTDHLGTPVMATDDAAPPVVIWSGGFEPFGRDWQSGTSAGALENGVFLRLPGQWEDEFWSDATLGAPMAYNVHRWYQYGTGRYSRADPIGVIDAELFSALSPDDQLRANHLYAYSASRPLLEIDPLGLKSKVCCKLIRKTVLFKHCYIKSVDDQTGAETTFGLLKTGPFTRTGRYIPNNSFDTRDPEGDCGEWTETCIVDDCVREQASQYPNPSKYRFVRGPNSNTFAGTVARACGLIPPGVAGTWRTPGWNKPPAPPATRP